MDDETKFKWAVGGFMIFIVFWFIFVFFIDHVSDNAMTVSEQVPLTTTYYEDIKQKEADAKKQLNTKMTNGQIAQNVLLKQIGLNASDQGYAIDSVQSNDGVFIQQGIINGNGIPYNSDYVNDTGINIFSGSNANNSDYWDKLKTDDYNKMIQSAKTDIASQNTADAQTADIKGIIEKAKADQKTKQNNLNSKDLKSQFVQKSKTENAKGNAKDTANSSSVKTNSSSK